MSFTPPVNAIGYLLRHGVDLDAIGQTGSFEDTPPDLLDAILGGAADFARDVFAPINWDGDQNPATLEDGNVTASPGFKSAYKQFVDGAWQTVALPAEIGGMGLPSTVSVATNEMLYAANMALGLCPMLTSSAIKAIDAHASDALKTTYLPKMLAGEWTGAMCLTEPQAGSDLGPVRSKAVDNGDGTYAISGQKIYITWGDHDCADNIIHLVLARLPDSPAGSRGISLFICPKYLVNEDGSLGDRNDFQPIGLEHKLGIHGSPTCTMEFSGATGYLVGEVNRGLASMFIMMNEARLFVGVQGVAIGERAYQAALQYAHDRVQGVPPGQEAGAPIIDHPDVRRMLIDMKAKLMGARSICLATAEAGDLGNHAREGLLTPIAKAYGSDTGVDVSSVAVQIHGGMGFVEETGAAQHYRDSRIAPIYEGTNGIQAMDLIGRKLRRDGGEAMRDLIAELRDGVKTVQGASGQGGVDLSVCAAAMEQGLETLTTATDIILSATDVDALGVATTYLELCAKVISGSLLARTVARGVVAGDEQSAAMASLARYHALRIMPTAGGLLISIRAGADPIYDFPRDQLADL
ncbi:acyl-CoA dehydrogenase [Algimonas arctica]|uniref:3-methylmercaptopropionyl-CoA dehydrogenase n=1 Tax=Algimonas arctica TaxID=1479486 RepID=A0A8J3CT13_9PROT|nr:acyl-CoA dehydrogenase [Algimonas arctica]GHA97517.1 acyl-CoA dehydrogenase [Algimonas arctica]